MANRQPPIRTVAICIITYKRPVLLKALLDSISVMTTDVSWRVVLVDNDPEGSARGVSESSLMSDKITYAVEPKPGIPSARNACLRMLKPSDDAIVFVDDDEWVDADWLTQLVSAADKSDMPVVGGPVATVLDSDAPHWARRGKYFQRPIPASGLRRVGTPYTNNSLVRVSSWRGADVWFDELNFADTGGSDVDFFSRLLKSLQSEWYWTGAAVVYEGVPSERLSVGWLVRRGVRGGNVMCRQRMSNSSRGVLMLEAIALVVIGLPMHLLCHLVYPRYARKAFVAWTRGMGYVGALSGRLVHEYRREG